MLTYCLVVKVKDVCSSYHVSKSVVYKWIRKYKSVYSANQFVDVSNEYNIYLNNRMNDILKLVINDTYTIEFQINKLMYVLEVINNVKIK